jgi:hypothetical protein
LNVNEVLSYKLYCTKEAKSLAVWLELHYDNLTYRNWGIL